MNLRNHIQCKLIVHWSILEVLDKFFDDTMVSLEHSSVHARLSHYPVQDQRQTCVHVTLFVSQPDVRDEFYIGLLSYQLTSNRLNRKKKYIQNHQVDQKNISQFGLGALGSEDIEDGNLGNHDSNLQCHLSLFGISHFSIHVTLLHLCNQMYSKIRHLDRMYSLPSVVVSLSFVADRCGYIEPCHRTSRPCQHYLAYKLSFVRHRPLFHSSILLHMSIPNHFRCIHMIHELVLATVHSMLSFLVTKIDIVLSTYLHKMVDSGSKKH